MTTFEQWREADLAWTQENPEMRELAFRWLREDGYWPTIEELQRFLFRSGFPRVLDPQAVADSKPRVPGQLAVATQERLTLGARHLLDLVSARPLLDLLVAATARAIEVYSGPSEQPSVRYDDERFFGFDSDTVVRLPPLIASDHPNVFGGGSYVDRWDIGVSAALVRDFVGASNPHEYVECQLRVIERWAGELDATRGTRKEGPATAFVVMPFGESWSEGIYASIGRAVRALDERLVAIRADEIARLGRITDQIIEAIRDADIVIADITGLNPNVLWELGYASALGKPCALLMRRGEGAPFDIYDHRRIDYDASPTADDERRLAELLVSTLDSL